MNAIIDQLPSPFTGNKTRVSEPLSGEKITIGDGFRATSFRAEDIGEAMDPLVMVDHYFMTAPTFGPHPHAGMSAVSLLFEDSHGEFHNRDSLGNDINLKPGDMYWLSAGCGAVHDESPRKNARIHGLQVFVNVPQIQRFKSPTSLLVRSEEMPVIKNKYARVKLVLGESNGVQAKTSPSIPMTILDGTINPNGHFSHDTAASRGIWIQNLKGSVDVVIGETTRHLTQGQALAIKSSNIEKITIRNTSHEPVQFALFDGSQIAERYIQEGPFVMGSRDEIAQIKEAYKAGKLGRLPDKRRF